MFAEIASVIAAVGGLISAYKSIPEFVDKKRRKRLGQKLVQVQMQLNQILDSGFEIIESIESCINSEEVKTDTEDLIERLTEQEKRIRTFIALFLDPDTKSLFEMLDRHLKRDVGRDLSEKRLLILTELDEFGRADFGHRRGYFQRQLRELYDPKRLKQSKSRLNRLKRESEKLSDLIRENFSLEELI